MTGLMLGPALGGVIAGVGGSIRMPFFLSSGVAAACALAVFSMSIRLEASKGISHPGIGHHSSVRTDFRTIARSDGIGLLFVLASAQFFLQLVYASMEALFPLYLTERLGASLAQIGFLFTYNFLIIALLQPVAGFLCDRTTSGSIIPFGTTLIGIAFAGLAFAPGYESFVIVLTLELVGAGLIMPSWRKLVSTSFSMQPGKAFGVLGAIGDVGLLAGPAAAGVLYDASPVAMFLGITTVSFLITAAFFWMIKRGRRQPTEDWEKGEAGC